MSDLLEGALSLAADHYPGLDRARVRRQLDEHAEPLRELALARSDASAQAAALRRRLHDELGYRGNEEDYYDPRNSFVNEVLERRVGIPITLSLVYVEVARRCGIPAGGVAFPGHFLVRIDARPGGVESALFIDPFNGGRELTRGELSRLARRVTGAALQQRQLLPASDAEVLVRMHTNLRAIFARRGDYPGLLLVLERLAEWVPEEPELARDRAVVLARLGAPAAARAQLQAYLERRPDADDRDELEALVARLTGSSSTALN